MVCDIWRGHPSLGCLLDSLALWTYFSIFGMCSAQRWLWLVIPSLILAFGTIWLSFVRWLRHLGPFRFPFHLSVSLLLFACLFAFVILVYCFCFVVGQVNLWFTLSLLFVWFAHCLRLTWWRCRVCSPTFGSAVRCSTFWVSPERWENRREMVGWREKEQKGFVFFLYYSCCWSCSCLWLWLCLWWDVGVDVGFWVLFWGVWSWCWVLSVVLGCLELTLGFVCVLGSCDETWG